MKPSSRLLYSLRSSEAREYTWWSSQSALLGIFIILCAFLAGCTGARSNGSNSGSATAITSLSVSCNASAVPVTETNQCTANVQGTGSFSSAVTWSVDAVPGGDSTIGTISSSGLYTSPANVPSTPSVTITATSQQDSSKSANFIVNVKLKITVSSQASSVAVFHSDQVAAVVSGVTNTSVLWSVNGSLGGNLTAGQIDSNGYYTAPNQPPSPATVTITATSQADPTQNATATVTISSDTTPPSILSVSPVQGATGVAQTAPIRIQFSEALDPATINFGTFTLRHGSAPIPVTSSYDPSTNSVTLVPEGLLEAGFIYTATVGPAVSDLAENVIGTAYNWSFTTQTAEVVNAAVSVPPGLDPTTLTTLSFGGQESTPDANGTFSASVRPFGTSLVAAMFPDKHFGFLAFAIAGAQTSSTETASAAQQFLAKRGQIPAARSVEFTKWQITASPQAASSPGAMTLDFQTTAESLLFLTPILFHANPANADVIMAAIASDPNTAALAQTLAAVWNEPEPLQDPSVQTALHIAMTSVVGVLTTVPATQSAAAGLQSESEIQLPQQQLQAAASSSTISNSLLVATTPNCTISTAVVLPCLDLSFVNLPPPGSPDSAGNYNFVPDTQNCPANLYLGCATGWLAQVSPITTNLPSGGASAITPGLGSNGPDSPLGPFAPNCTFPSGTSNCTGIFWIPSSSKFGQYVDPVAAIEAATQNLAGQPTPVPGFNLPAQTQQNYIARFYSGGLADSAEFSNVLSGSYTSGLYLWSTALTLNALDSVSDFLAATGVVPDQTLTCTVHEFETTQMIPEVLQVQQQFSNPNADYPSLFFATATTVVGDFAGDVGSCILDSATTNLFGLILDLSGQVGKDLTLLPQTLTAVSNVGQIAQKIFEMAAEASPLETSIVSVGAIGPQVASLQVICPSSTMTIGQQQTCSVTARDAQGSVIPSGQVAFQWSSVGTINASSNGSSAQVSATAIGQSTLVVMAPRYPGGLFVQGSLVLTVSQAALSSLIATPSSLNVPVGGTYKIVLQGVDSLGNAVAVSSVTWGPSTGSVATAVVWPGIANAGQVQAVGAGNVTVTASANGVQVKIPVTVYTPAATQTSISLLWGQMVVPATGLSYPDEVAVGGTGNIYVGDYNGGSPDDPTYDCTPSGCVPSSRPAVTKLDPLGNQTAVPTSGVNSSYGVAVDRSDNVYIADEQQNRIVKVTPQGAQTTLAQLCEVQSIAVDNIGNVYAWGGCPGVDPLLPGPLGLVKINPQGAQSLVSTTGLNNISDHFAVDANGNVYVPSNGNIVKIDPQDNQTIVASGLGVVDRVSVDASGNLYMTQQASGNSVVLLKQTSGGVRVTLGSGFSQNVQGIAVDGNGNVYVMDTGNIRALKIQPGPSIEVGIAPIGQSTQATLTYQIAGGATVGSVTATGAYNTSEFSVANGSGCVSTNGTCSVLVNFVPAASGMRTGSITLYDQNHQPLLTTTLFGIGR